MNGYKSAVNCLGIKPGERVLILADTEMDRVLVERLASEVRKIASPRVVVMDPTGRHGAEPEPEIAELMLEFDAEFLVTTYSLSHTEARQKASDRGARIASMPGITRDIMEEGAMLADYSEVRKLTEKMQGILENGSEIRIKSPSGTDVSFSIPNRILPDTGLYWNPGDFGNLPAGEAFTAPSGGAGRIVFDFFEKEEGVEIFLEDGRTVSTNSALLERTMSELGEAAGVLAEFGVGTNPRARVTGNILEDEKVFGTVHLAFGNNIHFGGQNDVPFHQDGIILKPTVWVDGKKIIEEGRWLV